LNEIPGLPPPKRHPYDEWSPDARALDLVGDKWTLLIVRDLAAGPRRFVEIQRVLPGISTEQLRSRLNRMVADGLLTRERYREVPPRVDYELTDRARDLMPVLGALARWGFRWTWGEPNEGEYIDVGAIFRLIPGLFRPEDINGRTVELTVRREPETSSRHYLIGTETDLVTIAERPAPEADAHVAGTQSAWVAALGPRRLRDGLSITGDAAAAEELLDALDRAAVASRV